MPRRICKNCDLVLSDKTSYSRHINHTCPKRPKPDNIAMENEELKKKLKNMTDARETNTQQQPTETEQSIDDEEVSTEDDIEEVSSENEPITAHHKTTRSFNND